MGSKTIVQDGKSTRYIGDLLTRIIGCDLVANALLEP